VTDGDHNLPVPVPVQTGEVRVIGAPAALDRPLRVALAPAVIAATGGFLVGVVSFVLVRVLRRGPKSGRRSLAGRGRGGRKDVVASRSFLVDVHLLRR